MVSKMRIITASIGVVFLMFHAHADSLKAIREPGFYFATPKKSCGASLKNSLQGGFLQLFLGKDQGHLAHIADDVTAITWVTPHTLVYSVSPVYGSPGIYLVKCYRGRMPTLLVGAEHRDKAYPQGSDYFELSSIVKSTLNYYYAGNVDTIDFLQLRADKNLRSYQLIKPY